MIKKIAFLVFSLVLASCAPDPIDVAEAGAIRIQAQQSALDQVQERTHQQALNEIAEAERQAISDETVAAERKRLAAETEAAIAAAEARRVFARWAGAAGALSLGIVLLSLALTLSWGMIGIGKAGARAAEVKANLIPLDAVSRQFPLVLQYQGKGRYGLANPNTGSVVILDTRRDEDRQMIAVSGAVQIAGAIAAEARKSKDPASLATIRPPIISARSREVSVGEVMSGDEWNER